LITGKCDEVAHVHSGGVLLAEHGVAPVACFGEAFARGLESGADGGDVHPCDRGGGVAVET
jgi:hypothetical protein